MDQKFFCSSGIPTENGEAQSCGKILQFLDAAELRLLLG